MLMEKSTKTRPGTDCGSDHFLIQRQRIDAFKLWCWRRLLRVPWTARSNQSILKEISPEYSLERTDAEAETLIHWIPPIPDAGKD